MSALWNILSVIFSLLGIVLAFNVDMNNPLLITLVLLVFGVAMFSFGYTVREARDRFNDIAETLTQKAARKAVNDKMPEIQEAVDNAVSKAIENIDIDELSRQIEDSERYSLRMKGKRP